MSCDYSKTRERVQLLPLNLKDTIVGSSKKNTTILKSHFYIYKRPITLSQ